MVHIAASHGFTNILDLYLSQYPYVERSYLLCCLALTPRNALQLRGRLGRFKRIYSTSRCCHEGRSRGGSGARYAFPSSDHRS